MALYHVTTLKKLGKYVANGGRIAPPVRAWINIGAAERFSKQTGRRIILRLADDGHWEPYEGHRGEAVWRQFPASIEGF